MSHKDKIVILILTAKANNFVEYRVARVPHDFDPKDESGEHVFDAVKIIRAFGLCEIYKDDAEAIPIAFKLGGGEGLEVQTLKFNYSFDVFLHAFWYKFEKNHLDRLVLGSDKSCEEIAHDLVETIKFYNKVHSLRYSQIHKFFPKKKT